LGRQIRSLRIDKGIGLRELARQVNVTAVAINNIEKDKVKKPSPYLIKKIASVLEYSSDLLLAKARMIDPEVEQVIIRRPTIIPAFLRTAHNLTNSQWQILQRQVTAIQSLPPRDSGTFTELNSVVLVVEDDPTHLQYMLALLNKLNILALSSTTGEEALKVLETALVDCVLLDVNLGAGISGLTVVAELKQQEKHLDIPIIAVTAYYGQGKHTELMEKGFTDYLAKPYRFNQLHGMLRNYGVS
jgi:CheY-like chemotaxis protein/DNA-binding XRE family transcriptional regulator